MKRPVALMWVTLASATLVAQVPIPVTNPSFEEPAQADGVYTVRSVPGWTLSAGTETGVINPTNVQFPGASDPGSGVPDGKQVLWLNTVGTVSQTVATSVQAFTEYTLSVAIGSRLDQLPIATNVCYVELQAGGQLLGAASPDTVKGAFATATVRYTALPGDPALGKPLQIVLRKTRTLFAESVTFDRVVLEARPSNSEPVGSGLVAHWKFDEPSGTVARDLTGKHDGQLSTTGATFVSGGVSGGALQFDRVLNGYVIVPPLTQLVANDFSAMLWVKTAPGDVTPMTYPFCLHEGWYANGVYLQLHDVGGSVGVPGKTTLVINDANPVTASSSVNDGAWHQIGFTYTKGGQTQLYVDGAPSEVSMASPPIIDRSPPLVIGGLYGQVTTGVPGGYFTGWVDDVQIYGQALTDTQVDLLFQNPGKNLAEVEKPIRISPNGGNFVASVDVTLSTSVAGAQIRYTLDGSEPLITSVRYQTPFTLRDTTTVKARLFINDFPASDVVAATFTKLSDVAFQPAGGLFTNSVQVTIINRLGLGTPLYTTNGSDPIATSPAYTTPITLTLAATLKARLFLNGFPVSAIATADFARVYAIDDGIPAEWREKYFGPGYLTDPRVAADADPDGDGWNNFVEYQYDTNPMDKASAPEILAKIRAIPRVDWESIPGLKYRVLRKTSVNAPNWEVVVPTFAATETQSRYIDVDAPATAIYQIELVP